MSKNGVIALLVLAAGVALVAMRGCDRDTPPVATESTRDAIPATAPTGTTDADPGTAQARAEVIERRNRALRASVSTLHRYLAALPGEDRSAADAFWVDGKPARDADEADLRALPAAPTYFRTRNRTPEALDRAPVPAAVRIPVVLRLGLEDRPLQVYEGWYELRRGDGEEDWSITNAALDATKPRS